MRRILILLGGCIVGGLLVAHKPVVHSAPQRYNVLLIATDDWKPVAGCYGSADAGTAQVQTPNIDRLANQGTVFLRNYCQQAVCAPTRASLLTGQRPDYTRVWDLKTQIRAMNPAILTMPQYFRQQGYVTSGIGKVFDGRSVDKYADSLSWSVPYYKLGPTDYPAGFAPPVGAYQNPETRQRIAQLTAEAAAQGIQSGPLLTQYLQQRFNPVDEGEAIPDGAYTDGAIGRKAQAIIGQLARQSTPFFFAVGFRSPHLPFVAPKKYWDLYDRDKLKLAAYQQKSQNPVDVAYQPSGELVNQYTGTHGERFQPGFEPKSDSIQRRLLHGYYASVSYMDAQIGLLLDALKANGLDKNTVVVLWGDHGWHLGDHAMWCKHTNFEQATRSPLIITAPGFNGNQKTESLTEFVDVFPTLCQLTGLNIPGNLAGRSLVPILQKPTVPIKNRAFSQYPRNNDRVMGYAVRTGRYRYVAWYEGEFRKQTTGPDQTPIAVELYDYQQDPDERVNVASQTSYQPVARLHEQLVCDFLKNQPRSR